MNFLLFPIIGIEKNCDRSGVLGRRERGWHTWLVRGELGDHGSLVTYNSDNQKLWRGGLFGAATSFLLNLERRVCNQ